jgi:uncharacterized membrane protein
MSPRSLERLRDGLRLALVALYTAAGLGHLLTPAKFLAITPAWVPQAKLVIAATGVFELAAAAALLHPRSRALAGMLLAAYAVAVFPANINQALNGIVVPPIPDSWWYHGPRLLLQPVLVWAGFFAGGAVDWPWRRPEQR